MATRVKKREGACLETHRNALPIRRENKFCPFGWIDHKGITHIIVIGCECPERLISDLTKEIRFIRNNSVVVCMP